MKLILSPRRFVRANTYFTVLVIASVTGLILAAYLTMVQTQNTMTMRSQAWNRSIAVAEAGIEEGLTHLQKNGTTNYNLLVDGWWNLGGSYYKRAYLDEGIYEVQVSKDPSPVITATGYLPMVQNYAARRQAGPFLAGLIFWDGTSSDRYLYRTVRVTTGADGMFMKGIVVKYWVDMNGNGVRVDSFDSTDPDHSTNGLYYRPWCKDNGDVATTAGLTNSFTEMTLGNANIFGRISTGPGGTYSLGPNGAVGSLAWQAEGHSGLQPGYFRDDMNVNFPPVGVPFSGGYTPSGGTYSNKTYDVILGSGNYVSTSNQKFSGQKEILVNGQAVWWCKAGIGFAGQGAITILPGASLKLYVGNTTGTGISCDISGNGIINGSGNATNCMMYGLPSCTDIKYSGNATYTGTIYAPNADFTLGGGGSNDQDFVGASVTSTLRMNGHFNIHYDEALGRFGGVRGYIVTSWNEIVQDGHQRN